LPARRHGQARNHLGDSVLACPNGAIEEWLKLLDGDKHILIRSTAFAFAEFLQMPTHSRKGAGQVAPPICRSAYRHPRSIRCGQERFRSRQKPLACPFGRGMARGDERCGSPTAHNSDQQASHIHCDEL
jgi:hypothetical protein